MQHLFGDWGGERTALAEEGGVGESPRAELCPLVQTVLALAAGISVLLGRWRELPRSKRRHLRIPSKSGLLILMGKGVTDETAS